MKNEISDDTSKPADLATSSLPTPVTETPVVATSPTGTPLSANGQRGARRGKYAAAALLLIVLCLIAGVGGGYLSNFGDASTVISRDANGDGNKIVTQEEEDISAVATGVGPSVVSIITKGTSQNYYGTTQTKQGAGTGIIVSGDGYVLTNKHVVDGSQTVSVVTSDGVTHTDVKVIGADPLNDIAFLKINGVTNLKAAKLGDSSSVRIGQKVVAIGNSLGQYQNTVTSGIISGTGRPVSAESEGSVENLTDLLQTDAAINPGNSGGPLTNIAGEVIGINTAIAADAQGIGFSIPINAAKGLLKGVLANGKIARSYVGVNYISITPDIAQQEKLPLKTGAWVHADQGSGVVAGSPADKAGIKDGDIITKIGDIDVGDKGGVASLVGEYAPGDTVKIELFRGGKMLSVNVTFATFQG